MNNSLPSNEDTAYWQKVYREAPVNVLKAVKEGAKQLVTITSTLQGLYFLAISVSDIRSAVTDWRIILFTLPVIPWLVCLGLAVSVFVPESRYIIRKPDRIEGAFRATASNKLRLLQWAQWILLLSMLLLFADVVFYLLWIPRPTPSP